VPVNADHEIRCYALRRLNPFLGVLQVVETPSGRASSSNGLVWDIQLLTQAPADWGSLDSAHHAKAWYRYGLWSERDGLVRRPLAAQTQDSALIRDGEALVEQLRTQLDRLPFALADRRELWLLDAQQHKPLALLLALRPGDTPPRPEPRRWSGCLGQQGVAGQRRFPDIEALEAQVRTRAGFNIRRAWVTWNPDHSELVDADAGLTADSGFSAWGLREDWPEADDQARVQRYTDWAAPALLTLPYLSDEQRARLESRLSGQAVSVEYHWRLYPKVLDSNNLTAARVQASLESSSVQSHP
jgi:hypothetical protein